MKLVGRGDTTVVDAYLSPILRAYVDRVAAETGDVRLMFMQSNGGLVDARLFQGKDAILSGPAGGIVGAAKTAALAGLDRIVGFDMGGTSTDVTHYAGAFERAFDTEVAGVRIRAPMMKIHTVAAGGGSIVSFDGQRFRVGPESAGANPGPACYRRGGPLGGHRRQPDGRQAPARLLPARVRPGGRPAARRRGGARRVRRAGARGREVDRHRAHARGAGAWLPRHRQRQHGQRDQGDLGPARHRRDHGLRAVLLRRRRRAARLPGGRPARASAGSSSTPTPRCCRPTAWASPTCACCASRRSSGRSTRRSTAELEAAVAALGAEAAARAARPGRARRAHRASRRGSMSATPAPTPRSRCRWPTPRRCARRSRPSTARATASSSRAAASWSRRSRSRASAPWRRWSSRSCRPPPASTRSSRC